METLPASGPEEAALKPCKYIVRLAKRKSKKIKKSESDRDFYRLAALLANPDLDEHEASVMEVSQNGAIDYFASKYLEESYQEKSPVLIAQGSRLKPPAFSDRHMKAVFEKWLMAQCSHHAFSKLKLEKPKKRGDGFYLFDQPTKAMTKNEITFSIAEQSILLSMISHEVMNMVTMNHKDSSLSAMEFHGLLNDHLHKDRCRPLLLLGMQGSEKKAFLVDRARLFWSHRMRLKSLQMKGGAEPSIRYFHAACHSSERPSEQADVLYWLKFDDENQALHGEFIDAAEHSFLPKSLICPLEALKKICSTSLEPEHFWQSVVRMYLNMAND